ncbi:hypothetical protein RIF29_30706 [Crotalaria pallida]|uniref:Bulb-type lectin domain-containing protein n=1 Tax=Crotalaria pallida TaxID=3830 RepID=A0AAN9ENC9_CROPI
MVWCKLGKPYVLLVFTCYLWLLTCCYIHVKAVNDTLKPGDSLSGSNKLCSQKGTYCMKFFQLLGDQGGLTPTYYLGIYTDLKDNWVVWNANRNQPIANSTGLLSLDHSGNLKLETKGDEKPIFLYSSPPQSSNSSNVVATLLDTGNFLLHQLHPNGSTKSVLWQSFDYPTDTLLPGMKLGVNHKNGNKWSLVSSLSSSNPAPGPFRLEWEPRGPELAIKIHGQVIWRSGKLTNKRFEHISKQSQHMYKYNVVSNEDEEYFTFTNPNEELTKWALYETGQLLGSEGNDIAIADMCYGYNTDGGCQKWEDIPPCRHPGDVFVLKAAQPKYMGDNTKIERNKSYGINDCQAWCWSNCSCVGFHELYDDGTGCIFFLGNLTEGTNIASRGKKFYTLVKHAQNKSAKKWIWASTIIAIVLLIICSSILCLAISRRKHVLEDNRRKKLETGMQYSTASDESTTLKDIEEDLNKGHNLKVFSYASVMEATSNFSSENKLGQGGFGPVYKAWELWNDGLCLQLMDPSLNDTFVPDEVQTCIHVSLLCVEHYPKDRPNMSDIISMLTNKSSIHIVPKRPAFYVGRQIFEEKTSSKSIESNRDSTTEISTSTIVEPR